MTDETSVLAPVSSDTPPAKGKEKGKKGVLVGTAAAVGVGSAAIVAALMYANKRRK